MIIEARKPLSQTNSTWMIFSRNDCKTIAFAIRSVDRWVMLCDSCQERRRILGIVDYVRCAFGIFRLTQPTKTCHQKFLLSLFLQSVLDSIRECKLINLSRLFNIRPGSFAELGDGLLLAERMGCCIPQKAPAARHLDLRIVFNRAAECNSGIVDELWITLHAFSYFTCPLFDLLTRLLNAERHALIPIETPAHQTTEQLLVLQYFTRFYCTNDFLRFSHWYATRIRHFYLLVFLVSLSYFQNFCKHNADGVGKLARSR